MFGHALFCYNGWFGQLLTGGVLVTMHGLLANGLSFGWQWICTWMFMLAVVRNVFIIIHDADGVITMNHCVYKGAQFTWRAVC